MQIFTDTTPSNVYLPLPNRRPRLRRVHDVLRNGAPLQPVYAYGGYWRDTIFLASNRRTPDMDFALEVETFRQWPKELRRQFRVPSKFRHFRREEAKLGNGKYKLERPYVLESRPGANITQLAGCTVGLTLVWQLPALEAFVQSIDLGFCQVADDGRHLLTTEWFWHDYLSRTITVVRTENVEEIGRSLRRAGRFAARDARYQGRRVWLLMPGLSQAGLNLLPKSPHEPCSPWWQPKKGTFREIPLVA